MIKHSILGNKVHVYKRENSRYWQCSSFLKGKNRRTSTKEESLSAAKQFAEDWYLELRGKARAGLLKDEKTLNDAAEQFLAEYLVITGGERNPKWVEGHSIRLRVHLLPFFGNLPLSEVTAGKVQEYRVHRMTPQDKNPEHSKSNKPPTGKVPARKTIHNEIVTLRQVLKTAIRHGWLTALPELSPPYKTQGKIVHRPWFSPAEYKQLYEATRAHVKDIQPRYRWNAEQLHDFVLFMANTGLRPDEAKNLQFRDVEIEEDEYTGENILVIEVRGKRGVGYCKSMPGAVRPYERLKSRLRTIKDEGGKKKDILPAPMDLVFPGCYLKMFNGILNRINLKFDRDGNPRTSYSLRHTYICLRLMEGADIYQIAKNCRTSVEMIEQHYAAHIKTTLDTSAINVRKKPKKDNS